MAFPSAYLDAVALNAALAAMAGQGRFARLLFYLEACESGSMFEELLAADIGVLAVTAANSTSPSFAAFYDERWGGGGRWRWEELFTCAVLVFLSFSSTADSASVATTMKL